MIATRVRPRRALMEGSLLTSLVVLMGALNDHKRKTVTVGAAVLVLLSSREIWQQAIVWGAGFFNYVPPLVAALFFAWCVKHALDGNGRENKVLPTLLITLVGFLSCLCMENMTVFSLVLGISAVGYVLFTRKRLWGITTGWLIGTVIGTVVRHNTVIGHTEIRRDRRDHCEHLCHRRRVLCGHVTHARKVLFRNDQHVHRRFRLDVVEREHVLILIHFIGRDVPRDYLTKQAVHRHTLLNINRAASPRRYPQLPPRRRPP